MAEGMNNTSSITIGDVRRFAAELEVHRSFTAEFCKNNKDNKYNACARYIMEMPNKLEQGQRQIQHWILKSGGKVLPASSVEAKKCQAASLGPSAEYMICLDDVSANDKALITGAAFILFCAAAAFEWINSTYVEK